MLNKAYIDLGIIRQNAKAIKRKLKSEKLCAVVKANAYGFGAEKVANAIYDIVDCFAVCLVEEGVSLRLSGIDKKILVLTLPQDEDIERGILNDLTFTVDNIDLLNKINKVAKKIKRTVKIHVKYNVGMNRLGIDTISELKEFLNKSETKKFVKIEGFYSHLSNPQNKKCLNKERNKFLLAKRIVKSYNKNIICHLSASGGFLMGVKTDMARIGLLLYGYKPFKSDAVNVKPSFVLKIPVLKERTIKANDKVLYGNKRVFFKKKISLVRIGYADGLPRKAIKGQVGNRCMDVTAVVNDKNKKYIYIKDISLLSKYYGTIDYEILSKIMMRAERVYK